jgi:hypothetical protein
VPLTHFPLYGPHDFRFDRVVTILAHFAMTLNRSPGSDPTSTKRIGVVFAVRDLDCCNVTPMMSRMSPTINCMNE